jgi:hypothetical protein
VGAALAQRATPIAFGDWRACYLLVTRLLGGVLSAVEVGEPRQRRRDVRQCGTLTSHQVMSDRQHDEAAMSPGERAAFANGIEAGRIERERLRAEIERLVDWIADREPELVETAVATTPSRIS